MSILVQADEQTAILTINRPEVFNCLNLSTLKDLRQAIQELSLSKVIRTIIVTGAGEKAFCSGADLKERKTMTPAQVQEYIVMIRDTFTALEKLNKPVIAAVNGLALGGGTELALACDIRILAETSKMGLTETSLGIIPGAGGTQRLTRLVGKGKAKELIFTSRKVEAQEALEMGLANRIVKNDEVLEAAKEMARLIAANAPMALAQAKYAIDYGSEVDLATGLAIESNAYQVLIPTKDRLEGLQAFAEKRKPVYTGE
ncbi:enoyl-CoA hydratase-related protein [Ammoniphilus sp. YIM 78166]|uniref:enoyl-CoA hydratase-related protein n=1 Tax=Ammoniphilus sp. YIM 78166 TaxID=1644106 RepID=UPI00106F86EE|nr:enoyl-CoA hydratase-related protein [Ammoniphilus sp. YIM 78166]